MPNHIISVEENSVPNDNGTKRVIAISGIVSAVITVIVQAIIAIAKIVAGGN